MKNQQKDFPFDIKIGLKKIIEAYKERLRSESSAIEKEHLNNVLEYIHSFPKLTEGIDSKEELDKHCKPIEMLLSDLFPDVLSNNEIKAVVVPFNLHIFGKTKRFAKILDDAGEDFELRIRNLNEKMDFVYPCVAILEEYYGYKIDFSRPFIFDIPDKNGIIKHYRFAVNIDFIEIKPTENAVDITEEDVDILLQNPDDISIWKEKFPPKSWSVNGFTILNLIDITIDDGISDLKTALLAGNDNTSFYELPKIFKSIYKIPDLKVGCTLFNKKKNVFRQMPLKGIHSFILDKEQDLDCGTMGCPEAYRALVGEQHYFAISNVEEFAKTQKNRSFSQKLLSNDIKSCIFAPIVKDGELLGVLELVSSRKNELNSINAVKLEDILPYIVTAMGRSKSEYENRIKAVIQNECTSIHSSVVWVFEEEAKRFIDDFDKDGVAFFRDISFDNVYPLYGQIDVVGSSEERNRAIQGDLTMQLESVMEIIELAYKKEALSIYEQIKFRIEEFIDELKNINASSEQKVVQLIEKEINPMMNHIKKQSPALKKKVHEYSGLLNNETGMIYEHRKNYDDSLQNINRNMARFIDEKQLEAQKIYPHFFERYKTDGVDHNMYIGKSMVQHDSFNKVYLYNLRLWQLQTMCEMENKFYQIQMNAPLQLDAASLILVFNTTLSIRYRMDEKKFDIDGTYNARYEIIKKRIDKAYVKNTAERITQKGKIAIIYTQKGDEREYLRYIKYLQAKKYLSKNVELLELEDVQGVVGLKTIRVEVLYHKEEKPFEETFTYEDLMKELN